MRFISDIIRENQSAVRETDSDAVLAENALFDIQTIDTPAVSGDPDDRNSPGEHSASERMESVPEQMVPSQTDGPMSGAVDRISAEVPSEDTLAEENDDYEIESYYLSEGIARIDPFDRLNRSDDVRRGAASSVSPFSRSTKTQPFVDPATSVENHSSKEQLETELDDLETLDDLEAFLPLENAIKSKVDEDGKPVRVKTRLLGFAATEFEADDPFEKARNGANQFPVGWLVVISGSGRGACFVLKDGVSTVGRGDDQTVCLGFGDSSISRTNHASVAYDAEQGRFFIGHSGKANLVRLNNAPLLSTEELNSGDTIRLGQTTLRFVAFCGETFSWDAEPEGATGRA